MNQTENNQNDQRQQLVQQVLDSYFTFRENLPQDGYIQENKTTLQIQDELESMCHIDVYDIATYMLQHKYVPTTEGDGTVSWAIWRMLDRA